MLQGAALCAAWLRSCDSERECGTEGVKTDWFLDVVILL